MKRLFFAFLDWLRYAIFWYRKDHGLIPRDSKFYKTEEYFRDQ